MKTLLQAAAACALLFAVPAAQAAEITPVGAVASDTFSFFNEHPVENLINGAGLIGDLHQGGEQIYQGMWMTNLGVNQANIVFDLGQVYALEGIDIWQYNFGNPAQFQSSILRGVQDFTLELSLDGVTYGAPVAGTLALGTGQPLAAQTFALSGDARFVRLDILNNYGKGTYAEADWNSGLSEVRFEGAAVAAVPEPAAWAMMIGGFGLVGAAMRRRSAVVRAA